MTVGGGTLLPSVGSQQVGCLSRPTFLGRELWGLPGPGPAVFPACQAGSAWPQTGTQKPNVCCGRVMCLSSSHTKFTMCSDVNVAGVLV